MKNVYDLKKEHALDFILPKKDKLYGKCEIQNFEKVVIVIHLFYLEKIPVYFEYIKNIPEEIQIIFTVSSMDAERILNSYLKGTSKKYKIIVKRNRGRDISALLVAAREELLKYEYVCFLHDKKEKSALTKKDVEHWEYCLWENTVGSREYIFNVLHLFAKNKGIGMLVPPIPISENMEYGYSNTWAKNFNSAKKIAKQFHLTCDLDETKTPIALGTVFWARGAALNKIFMHKWEYEDFEDEPLKDDGTLSHAIERLLPYVVQDSGYEIGWVMTDKYAAENMEYFMDIFNITFELIEKTYGLHHIAEIRNFLRLVKELSLFCKQFCNIYIYGAGGMGKKCFRILLNLGITPRGFLVTAKKNESALLGVQIQKIEDVPLDKNCGILVAVQEKYRREIEEELMARRISSQNIFVFDE